MSTPILALALAVMCALFSAAAADTAQVIGLRNQAANEARRVAVSTLDACALGDGASGRCAPPATCAGDECSVCWSDGAVRADVSSQWSPILLRGLTPAHGRHALNLDALSVAHLADRSLPTCTSSSSKH